MNTIFMNSENRKIPDLHRLSVNLTDKVDWRRKDKYITLPNLSIYYAWKNIKNSYKNNKFKISASTWNEEFELPDRSYSVSDIQDYFEYILKKHGEIIKMINDNNNPSIKVYVNKIENIITLLIKTRYILNL